MKLSYYSDFHKWKQYEERNNKSYTVEKNDSIHLDGVKQQNSSFGLNNFINKDRIIERLNNCIYCNSKLTHQRIDRDLRNSHIDTHRRESKRGWAAEVCDKVIEVIYCDQCNWWYILSSKYFENWVYGVYEDYHTIYEGIIKEFNVTDQEIPNEVLRKHLENQPDLIHLVNPKRFELLVADIFKDFYNCEVRHVGGTNDGGIDLVAIISDQPHLIQVKRRASSTKSESVSVVRELIGTLVTHDTKSGIVVSSASSFSKQAVETSLNHNLLRYNFKLDLISKNDLFAMMKLSPVNAPYSYILEKLSDVSSDRLGYDEI